MPRRLHQTLADYMVVAISPALIVALVASLMFFLLEIAYSGELAGRMNWICFWFVVGAVLIARIAMEEGAERAALFGLALAGAMLLAMGRLMEVAPGSWAARFSLPINAAIIGVVWWCSHRLTYDCTLIDDDEDASGQGLLQWTGLDPMPEEEADVEGRESLYSRTRPRDKFADPPVATEEDLPTADSPPTSSLAWWQSLVPWLAPRKRRSAAPGASIVYFSLAALPIFGLGQMLVPASDVSRRRYVFGLLVIYVGSALGLLLTTSFLGLRRYLRQRRLEMPVAIAGVWLGVGSAMAVALLLAAALLPRPAAEYQISSFSGVAGSPDRQASRFAPLRDSPAQGRGAAANRPGETTAEQSGGAGAANTGTSGAQQQTATGQPGSGSGQGQSGPGAGNQQGSGGSSSGQSGGQSAGQGAQAPSGGQTPSSQAQGQASSQSQAGQSQSGQSTAEQGPSGQSSTNQGSSDQSASGRPASGQPSAGNSPDQRNSPTGSTANGQQQGGEPANARPPDSEQNPNPPPSSATSAASAPGGSTRRPTNPPSSQGSSSVSSRSSSSATAPPADAPWPEASFRLPDVGSRPAFAFRWLLNAALIAVAVYLVWRYWRQVLKFLRDLWTALRDLLASWFGGRQPAAEEEIAPAPARPAPFAAFANPFAGGEADRRRPDELVRYTFAAMEAWAWERGCGRPREATPLEFAAALGTAAPDVADEAREAALLFSRVAYAGDPLSSAAVRPVLSRLWTAMCGQVGVSGS